MFPAESKILIVDDSTFARSVLKNGLREMKYSRVFEADGPNVAKTFLLDPAQTNDPVDLLITDLHMPEVTGIEFLTWMRAVPEFKSMPVIVLSSSQDRGEIMEAGKLHISNFMIKPFNALQLKEKMISAWQKHGEKYFTERHGRPVSGTSRAKS